MKRLFPVRIPVILVRALKVAGIVAVTIAAAGIACETAPTAPSTSPVGFTLDITTPVAAITRGSQGPVTVTITRQGQFTGAVTLTAVGLDGSGTGDAVTVSVGRIEIGETSTVLIVTVSSAGQPGNGSLLVSGYASGYRTVERSAAFTVVAPGTIALVNRAGDFYVQPGGTLHATITVARTQYTQPVTLSVAGAPAGTTWSPSPTTNNSVDNVIAISVPIPADASLISDTSFTVTASGPGTASVSTTVHYGVRLPSYFLTGTGPATPIPFGGSGIATVVATREPGFTGAVSLTGASNQPAISVVPTTIPAGSTQAAVQINVTSALAPGTYSVTVSGTTPGISQGEITLFDIVIAGGFKLNVVTAPLNMSAPGTAQDVVTIARSVNFTGPVTVTALADPGISVIPSELPTPGNQTTLTVSTLPWVAAGMHLVQIKGVGANVPDDSTTFAVVVNLPAGGVPTGLVVIPSPATVAVNGIQQFTAYLVDAQGNRTLPAAGWEISILSESSAVAQDLAPPAYDVTQRWQTRPVKGVGVGSTQIHVAYDRISDGFTTFLVLVTFTVTP